MLTIADEGGGGVYEPPILADVICEQPLIDTFLEKPPLDTISVLSHLILACRAYHSTEVNVSLKLRWIIDDGV